MSPSSTSRACTAAAQQAPEKEDVRGQHHELWWGKHQQQQQQEEEPSQHLCPVQSGTCKHPVSILSSSSGVEGRVLCPWELLGGTPRDCLSEPSSCYVMGKRRRGCPSCLP